MIMGQFGQTISRILRKRHHKFLAYFGIFSSEDLDFTNFSFDVLEIFQCVFIKRETMIEITCKSYATDSILFQCDFYTVNATCRN